MLQKICFNGGGEGVNLTKCGGGGGFAIFFIGGGLKKPKLRGGVGVCILQFFGGGGKLDKMWIGGARNFIWGRDLKKTSVAKNFFFGGGVKLDKIRMGRWSQFFLGGGGGGEEFFSGRRVVMLERGKEDKKCGEGCIFLGGG